MGTIARIALLLLVAAFASQPFSPARAQSGAVRATGEEKEKMTPDGGCIRLMTEHRLYVTEGRIPSDNTLEAAILCARAPPSLCQRAMAEVRTRGAPVWAKYVMECRGQ